MPIFEKTTHLPQSPETVYAWHTRPGALQRLTPPGVPVKIVKSSQFIEDGSEVILKIGPGPLSLTWVARHQNCQPGRSFEDDSIKGPFSKWLHSHEFLPNGEGSYMRDRVTYQLPLSPVSQALMGRVVQKKLRELFDYRHKVLAQDLHRHHQFREKNTMTIAITGATGLVGKRLQAFLSTGGHEVISLVRRKPKDGQNEVFWDPETGKIDHQSLEGIGAVVHLAGENVAGGRWNDALKKRILDSRVQGTSLISKTLARLQNPPSTLVSASAIGFYGNRPGEVCGEDAKPGTGFLSEVVQAWEANSLPAAEAGIRVVNLRIGVVLAKEGGALSKMLMPFKMGVGGVVGSGNQMMSWVSLEDLIGMIHFSLMTDSLSGPVNGVAPNPVSNRQFTQALAKVLKRPAIFPMPAPVVKVVFGEMGEALLLEGVEVQPNRLKAAGYQFLHSNLPEALAFELGLPG